MVIYTEQWQIATCVWEQRAENNHYTTKISVLGEFPLRLCLRERASSPQMKFACTLDNTWTIYNCKIGIAVNVSALTLQKLPWGLLVKDYRSNQRFSLHKSYFKPAAYAKNGCNSLSVISMVQTEGREGSPNLSWSQCLLVFIQTLRNQQADTSGTIFCGKKVLPEAFMLFTCEILVSGKAAGGLPQPWSATMPSCSTFHRQYLTAGTLSQEKRKLLLKLEILKGNWAISLRDTFKSVL